MYHPRQRHKNIFFKLRHREINGCTRNFNAGTVTTFFRVCPRRLWTRLCDMAPNVQALIGHVYLGFSACGNYLISYSSTQIDQEELQETPGGIEYRIQWWRFRLRRKLTLARSEKLFNGTLQSSEMYLTVSQQNLNSYLVVGTPRIGGSTRSSESSIVCHADHFMFASNAVHDTMLKLSLDFPLVRPFPVHEPAIMTLPPSVLAFNTGSSIMVLFCDFKDATAYRRDGATPRQTSNCASQQDSSFMRTRSFTFCEGFNNNNGNSDQLQHSNINTHDGFMAMGITRDSVIWQQQIDKNDQRESIATVQQIRIDIEAILRKLSRSTTLPQLSVTGISDYDVRVANVEGLDIMCFVRAVMSTNFQQKHYLVEFMVLVSVGGGRDTVTVLSSSTPCLTKRSTLAARESSTRLTAQRISLKPPPRQTDYWISNLPVFSNTSLLYLRHPIQPIAIIL
eukprot:m.186207 g.186207  ORF g.186207 m.186207 type:complete len:451 (+) comp32258_c3_seq5:3328-4680(+)